MSFQVNTGMLKMQLIEHVVAWPSGLRRWFKAPVISMAWVRIPPLPVCLFFLFSFFALNRVIEISY